MKKIYRLISTRMSLFGTIFLLATKTLEAQNVSTFDDLSLTPEAHWNGSDLSGGFRSGDAYFYNSYSTEYSSWMGFAYSNSTDVISKGYTNDFSAITGEGYNGSANYAIGNFRASVKLSDVSEEGTTISGFYATNSTYAALSMRDGDDFAKKFGGATGNDPDWFLLTIEGFLAHEKKPDVVEFYLADFRFEDNTQDYIVDTWKWVDLTALGQVDSLVFSMSSSDVGEYGVNTPEYFAMDNFNDQVVTSIRKVQSDKVELYPNPVQNQLTIKWPGHHNTTLRVSDLNGKVVHQASGLHGSHIVQYLDFLNSGAYILTLESEDAIAHKPFIKY